MAGMADVLTPASFPPDTWGGRFLMLLLGVLTLLIMVATLRSSVVGLGSALSFAVIGLASRSPAVHWLPPVIGGVSMGLFAGQQLKPSVTIVGTGVAVGLGSSRSRPATWWHV